MVDPAGSSQVKDRRVVVGGNGRVFKKDEEGVDWYGLRNILEEEVIVEVSGWVQKGYEIESTHHHYSRENPGGGGT